MAKTKIEWADEVWNPVTGCSKVSQGCKNCYAETIANRFWGERKFTDVQLHLGRLGDPLHWKKPRRVFVNSMSDLFHEDVPVEFIRKVVNICSFADRHIFMILTKRPARMMEFFTKVYFKQGVIPNVRLGVSVEDQPTADERIPLLLQTPAAVRFVSVEPMLGPVDLWRFAKREETFGSMYDHRGTYEYARLAGFPAGSVKISEGIDWVICGGESGPHARPMHPDWARGLRDQCQVAGVPFFFKQWGEWAPADYQSLAWQFDRKERANQIAWWTVSSSTNKKSIGRRDPVAYDEIGKATLLERVGKKAAGRVLDGKTHDEYPGVE